MRWNRDLVPPEPGKDWQGSTDTPVKDASQELLKLWLVIFRLNGHYLTNTWETKLKADVDAQGWHMRGIQAWTGSIELEGDGTT